MEEKLKEVKINFGLVIFFFFILVVISIILLALQNKPTQTVATPLPSVELKFNWENETTSPASQLP